MESTHSILIVDDDVNVYHTLNAEFLPLGYKTYYAENGEIGLQLFDEIAPNLVVMDICTPVLTGIEVLRNMRVKNPYIPVILMAAYADVETAVEALSNGAFDFVIKPLVINDLNLLVQRALQLTFIKQELLKKLNSPIENRKSGHILTKSQQMMNIYKDIAKSALSQANVLIFGESGTGKEVIASEIHYNSRRATGPFIKINCAALPESLLESELFGHEKGAFTGAYKVRQGVFERAHNGSLLLDEIGDMSLSLQAKMLRILQEREFERIGGEQTIQIDTRIIAATNKNLESMVNEGTFREDLFYRLNVINLRLPPLRERREDIIILANYFLRKFSDENHKDIFFFDHSAMLRLTEWSWPGNIRELSNVIERAVVMTTGTVIFPETLQIQTGHSIKDTSENRMEKLETGGLKEEIRREERRIIINELKKHNGNRTRTALALGISRRALIYKIQEYSIVPLDI